jgi:hypothetical protein
MKKIFKYHFAAGTVSTIAMPIGAEILSVDDQGSTPTLWALVDPNAKEGIRKLAAVGTGWEIEPGSRVDSNTFVGTICMKEVPLVWHIFDLGYVKE